jgi:hypothetical protein
VAVASLIGRSPCASFRGSLRQAFDHGQSWSLKIATQYDWCSAILIDFEGLS